MIPLLPQPIRSLLSATVFFATLALGAHPAPAQTARAGANASAPHADMQTQSFLLFPDGRLRQGVVHSISRSGVVLQDRTGAIEEFAREGFLALVATSNRAEPQHGIGVGLPAEPADIERLRRQLDADELGVVELIDGQRLPGTPGTPDAGSDETFQWQVTDDASVDLPLERIARIIYPWAGIHRHTLPRTATEDLLVLINGDELSGFLASVGDVATIEIGEEAIQIEQQRIAGIVLANPKERPTGAMLWLDDGSVLRASTMITRSDLIFIESDLGVRIAPQIAHIRAIAYEAARIIPLSTLSPTGQAPVGDRWRADPIVLRTHPDDLLAAESPALGALDVFLPGPMRVDYELPRGAQRLVATSALTPGAAGWGDCELVMTLGGEELLRLHLHEQSSRSAINLPLVTASVGSTLTITLEPGRFGPIRNQVTLHRPLIIVEE